MAHTQTNKKSTKQTNKETDRQTDRDTHTSPKRHSIQHTHTHTETRARTRRDMCTHVLDSGLVALWSHAITLYVECSQNTTSASPSVKVLAGLEQNPCTMRIKRVRLQAVQLVAGGSSWAVCGHQTCYTGATD